MRGRKTVLGFGAALAVLAGVLPSASAAAQRNQITTYNYSVVFLGPGGLNIYFGTLSLSMACGHVIAGSGTLSGIPVALSDIAATPTATGGPASFTSTEYVDGAPGGDSWAFDGQLSSAGFRGDMTGPDFPPGNVDKWQELGNSTGVAVSQYANHGDFVSSAPASMRNAAATSSIGMPVQSSS
jgi:hypothetical protein